MRFVKYVVLELLLFISLTLAGCMLLGHSHNVVNFHTLLKTHALWLQLVRYLAISFILLCWPQLIKKMGGWLKWDDALIEVLAHKRLWVLGFFSVMEILFFYST